MKFAILVIAFLLPAPNSSHAASSLEDLQGAWWSDSDNLTAAFAIHGEQVWLEITTTYHPCRIEGDMLIFEIGESFGTVRNRIINLEGNELTLESPRTGQRRVLYRK